MIGINEIINIGSQMKASDIHLCVGRNIQYRVQGNLVCVQEEILQSSDVEQYARSLTDETLFEKIDQDLSVDFAKTIGNQVRIRCNIYKTNGNYACAIRILPHEIPSCESLDIPQSVIDISNKTKGLVLVTGPTSHGKTTTIASLINRINENENKHIITLEDPIEYVHTHKKSIVNQREIYSDAHSFASGLRAALRQDPDVILVGEMRDCETISTALTAAETGHLVLATLHTMDCATTINRIIDVFEPAQQAQIRVMLADVIECIVSQRLVPLKDGTRAAVYEVMTATSAIRNLIRENKTFQIYSQIQISRKDGMQTLDESLINLYNTGLVEKNELLKISTDPVSLQRKMR
ncbi:MAG: PilT/PilU family type 4a pilus ATPase [Clostridia bacterium]